MSFDLSQLDRLAKGELQERQEPKSTSSLKPATPRPRLRPQAARRKQREERRSGPWSVDGEDVSESGPSRDVTGSKRSEQESAVIPHDEPESAPEPEFEIEEFIEPARAPASKKRKGARRTSDDGGVKKATTRQNRLERLAALEDTSELPLCDLISRATYLEEKRLQEEAKTHKPTPPAAPPSPKPVNEAPPIVSSILAPQVTVVDGRLVVNEASLECTQTQTRDVTDGFTRVEESDDRIVNYHSYADWSTTRSSKWSREETEILVQGIGQFGIDFALLERLFPSRNRKQIKAKFSRMWKENPEVFGQHFNKAEGETDDSYTKFVEDLRAERTAPDETPLALPDEASS